MSYKCKRLNLNWSLEWRDERSKWANTYISSLPFTLNESEIEMISKYILWGKNPKTGLNGRQEGLELETSHGTWDSERTESLDALLESPTFTESMLRHPDDPVYKTKKHVFSRTEAREYATPEVLSSLETLWKTIDTLEVTIGFYDLAHQKRTKPLRDSLLQAFTPTDLDLLQHKGESLNSFQYLNKKHLLVELRKQQYTLRDSYAPPIYAEPTWQVSEKKPLFWDTDISVYPLGIKHKQEALSQLLFNCGKWPEPKDFSENDLKCLSKRLWTKYSTDKPVFDLTQERNLALLNEIQDECEDYLKEKGFLDSNVDELLDTFNYYCSITNLKDFQRMILDMKRSHKSNEQIVEAIYETYGHRYTVNYISTLYHKTILTLIAHTIQNHRVVCENLFFPEEFKECKDCGKILFKCNDNFMHKNRVSDGYDCRCKVCAKKLRERRQ